MAPLAAPAISNLLLPLLMSFGPAGLNKLFGGKDPNEDLRRKIMELLRPENLKALTAQLYQQNLQSPAYSQAQGTIAAGANETANQVAQNLGARGLGTTGTGAILSSLTPSLVGSQVAGLKTTAHNAALNSAQQNIASQISALTGTNGPSQTRQLVGAGIEAFQPYLQAYLRSRYPSMAANWTPQAVR